MKRISILGLGYIGLPTAILAAECGYEVFGFDINSEKIARINAGDPTILEPEIKKRLLHALKKKNFKASTNLEYADCFLVTVPTPLKPNRSPDLQYVFKACEYIAKRLMPGNLIIIESTVPVGTTEQLAKHIEDLSGLKQSVDFFITHCPERGLPGVLFRELVENDRVVGGICQKSCELAYLFYSKFVKGFLHVTDDKTAEMIKLVENSSRDVQIAFANQVASMCYTAGIDPYQVIELANKHPRVSILNPTCGVGGHCIAIDPAFLIDSFPNDTKLLQAAREVNNNKPLSVIERLLQKVDEFNEINKTKANILGLGLSFKPNVDDIRESPALFIAQQLSKKKDMLNFTAYDSYVDREHVEVLGIELATNLRKEINETDIILILVKHDEFKMIPHELLCNKIIIDSCGLLHEMGKHQTQKFLTGATKASCNLENITF
ncbi:nucleotide sugar dehydrogenase [Candidatus Babeliales bacterium]|nr:nucleotide sugar dehydrogenase [Candidatus Babeliales bacterium]